MSIVKTTLAAENQNTYNPITSRSAGCTHVELSALLELLGSEEAVISLPPVNGAGMITGWVLSDDITIPRTITLHIPHGTTVEVTAGNTLSINGPVDANNPNWYSGAGTVVFNYTSLDSEESFSQWGSGFVVSGGLHGTAASIISPSFGYRARTNNGRDIFGSGVTVTYGGGDGTYWVIGYQDTDGAVPSGWTRVGVTHLLTQKNATKPTLPAQGVWLMQVTISGDEITEVTDLRAMFFAPAGMRSGPIADRPAAGLRGRTWKRTDAGRGTDIDTGVGWARLEREWIDLREWTFSGTDITSPLELGIIEARANKMGLSIPAGIWTVDRKIIWGSSDGVTHLHPPPIRGVKRGGFSGNALSQITVDFDDAIFSCRGPNVGEPTLSAGHMENLTLENVNAGVNAYAFTMAGTSQMLFRGCEFHCGNVAFFGDGENIFPHWDYCTFVGSTGVGQIGANVFCRNGRFTGGGVFATNVGLKLGGNSIYIESFDTEFVQVALHTSVITDVVYDTCQFENFHCLLTNTTSAIPMDLSNDWVDNGGIGAVATGAVHYYGCTIAGPVVMHSNMLVIKPASPYGVIFQGCSISGEHLIATESFTPGSSDFLPEAFWAFYDSSSLLVFNWNPASSFQNYFHMGGFAALKVGKFNTVNVGDLSGNYGLALSGTLLKVSGADGIDMYVVSADKSVRWDGAAWFPNATGTADIGLAIREWNDAWLQNEPVVSSDRNIKEDIQDTVGLELIKKLRPVNFKFKGRVRRHHGLISQDVKETIDELGIDHGGYVYAGDDVENPHRLRPGEFISNLIKAVQEQQDQIEALERKVNDRVIQPPAKNAAAPRGPVRSPGAVKRGAKRVTRSRKSRSC